MARTVDRDVDAELAFHIETRTAELIARGMAAESARAAALREFGDLRAARAELGAIDRARVGHARRAEWWDEVRHDLRFATRQLVRSRGFTIAAVLTLALGIGANAAIFSVVNAVLLRPLPYPAPDRLVRVWSNHNVPPAVFTMLRDRSRSFAGIAGYSTGDEVSLTGDDKPVRLTAGTVTGTLFDVLGARAVIGHTFTAEDDQPGRDHLVVLSHALWRDRFGSDPRIIGRPVMIDGIARTVVGVMPASFHFPSPAVQLWTPAVFDPSNRQTYWWTWSLQVIARLGPGVTPGRAQADVAPIVLSAAAAFPWRLPDSWAKGVDVVPLQADIVGSTRPTLLILLGAVGLVLLIACVNVANLFLARATARVHEIALRAALGASRPRMIRQLLTESVLLGVIGGAAGFALAALTVRALIVFLPAGTPRAAEIGIDGHVLAVTMALAIVTGIAFGLVPALRLSRPNLQSALVGGMRSVGGTWARRHLSEALVVAQVALAVVLVIGAGLLIKSFWLLHQVDLGFRTEHVIVADIPLPSFPADTVARGRAFYSDVLARASALRAVHAVALADQLPFGDGSCGMPVSTDEHPTLPGTVAPIICNTTVTPDYFRVMGIPLLQGRNLSDADRKGTPLVAVIDEAGAHQFWPGENPIGKRIQSLSWGTWITIVGVVGNVKRDSLSATEQSSIYIPLLQGFFGPMHLVARTDADVGTIAPAIRAAVAQVDPNVPVSNVRSLGDVVSASAAGARFTMLLLAIFAAVALALGAVGIYGVIAYAVARRTREIGVRMALGARVGDVLGMVLREAGRLVAAGVGLGLVGAFLASRLLARLLYGVAPSDPVVFITAAVLLALVALLATLIPARRAARVDPLIALRYE